MPGVSPRGHSQEAGMMLATSLCGCGQSLRSLAECSLGLAFQVLEWGALGPSVLPLRCS